MSEKWAGDFSCGTCGRKRLIAADFSKKQLEKRSKDLTADIKCKQCVESAAAEERAEAAKRAADKAAALPSPSTKELAGSSADADAPATEQHVCSSCRQSLLAAAFSRAQLFKGEKRRCQSCVADAEKADASAATESRTLELEAARQALKKLEVSGASALEVAKAFAKVSALEGQQVTGLKPVILGRGRGRGRGGGRRGGGR